MRRHHYDVGREEQDEHEHNVACMCVDAGKVDDVCLVAGRDGLRVEDGCAGSSIGMGSVQTEGRQVPADAGWCWCKDVAGR
jgi:hypothetical protein